jgi:hypothetical protein
MFDHCRRRSAKRGREQAYRLVAFAALWLAAVPAQPQIAPGRSGTSGVRYLPEPDGWFAIRQLGLCIAQSKRDNARAFIAATPNSEEEDRLVQALIGSETSCLRNANYLVFTRDYLRGSVAEALYHRDYGSPPPAAPAESEQVDVRDLRSFALCFAMVRPDLVHRLISTTRLGQDEEGEAMSGMSGEFGQCLPAGLTLNLNPQEVRVALAEAIYRRASAPRTPATP